MRKRLKNTIISLLLIGGFSTLGVTAVVANVANEDQKWQRQCDGISIIDTCQDEDGQRYSKYVLHEAEPKVTKEINHPAVSPKTKIVHHEAVYGERQVPVCIKTTIGYKNGTCALSRCRDGEYSGSSGKGTCSYHGGVWYGGGPWYEYIIEKYLIKPAWDETVEVEPGKKAWTETIIVTPAKEAWIEKELAK